ncbi:hypothetical protein AAHC03_013648 [Spirometra sp. Aus1]
MSFLRTLGLSTRRKENGTKTPDINAQSPQYLDICASGVGLFLGTTAVPDSYGNDLCFYAHLLLLKASTDAKRKPQSARIVATDECITITQIKPNRLLAKCSLEHLSYVWIHPKDPFVFGFISAEENTSKADIQFKFTAMKMTSKAKIFAHNMRHIYCLRMNRANWALQEESENSSALWVSRVAPPFAGNFQNIRTRVSISSSLRGTELEDRQLDTISEGSCRKTSCPEYGMQDGNSPDIGVYTRVPRKSHSSINFTSTNKGSPTDIGSETLSQVESLTGLPVTFEEEHPTPCQEA